MAEFQRERAERMAQMREAGATSREVAVEFGVSPWRVHQIVAKLHAERRREQLAGSFLARVRNLNDIDALWDRQVLCQTLFPESVLAKRADALLSRKQQTSLRDLMDALIPIKPWHCETLWARMPAYEIRGIGKKTYAAMIQRLSELDLGSEFNSEWAEREQALKVWQTKRLQGLSTA